MTLQFFRQLDQSELIYFEHFNIILRKVTSVPSSNRTLELPSKRP